MSNTVKNLDGMFALCLLDTKSQLIHIARDPYGIKPLFKMFNAEDGVLAISSEAKGWTFCGSLCYMKHMI